MILEKDMAPFHALAELKQTVQPKNIILQIEMRELAHRIVKYVYH